MLNFLTVPNDVHDEFIRNALAANPTLNCNWSFKDISSNLKIQVDENTDTISIINSKNLSETSSQSYYPFSDTFRDFIKGSYFGKDKNIQFSNFFENIPVVIVRAYIPETVLGLFTSLLDITKEGVQSGLKAGAEVANQAKERFNESVEQKGFIETVEDCFEKLKGKIEELKNKLSDGDIYAKVHKQIVGIYSNNISKELDNFGTQYDDLILKVPYILYYKILRSKTNNIYEFPAIVNSIFKSNNYGWSSGTQANLGAKANGFLSYLANTIGTTLTPVFDTRNSDNEQIGFTITLDLINDTLIHAIQNYNFVQSLILYNMWVQYGIGLQGPGSLYDVKILGGQRFLMCTGNFTVTNKGILRKINNENIQTVISEWKPWRSEIRVPDVYSLQLEFKSLLPNNLNNYMISVATNNIASKPGDKNWGIMTKSNSDDDS